MINARAFQQHWLQKFWNIQDNEKDIHVKKPREWISKSRGVKFAIPHSLQFQDQSLRPQECTPKFECEGQNLRPGRGFLKVEERKGKKVKIRAGSGSAGPTNKNRRPYHIGITHTHASTTIIYGKYFFYQNGSSTFWHGTHLQFLWNFMPSPTINFNCPTFKFLV